MRKTKKRGWEREKKQKPSPRTNNSIRRELSGDLGRVFFRRARPAFYLGDFTTADNKPLPSLPLSLSLSLFSRALEGPKTLTGRNIRPVQSPHPTSCFRNFQARDVILYDAAETHRFSRSGRRIRESRGSCRAVSETGKKRRNSARSSFVVAAATDDDFCSCALRRAKLVEAKKHIIRSRGARVRGRWFNGTRQNYIYVNTRSCAIMKRSVTCRPFSLHLRAACLGEEKNETRVAFGGRVVLSKFIKSRCVYRHSSLTNSEYFHCVCTVRRTLMRYSICLTLSAHFSCAAVARVTSRSCPVNSLPYSKRTCLKSEPVKWMPRAQL